MLPDRWGCASPLLYRLGACPYEEFLKIQEYLVIPFISSISGNFIRCA